MSEITLTPSQIVEITGYKAKVKQTEWLTLNGWKFHLNRFNRPIVSLDYYKMRSGLVEHQNLIPSEPNWAALG